MKRKPYSISSAFSVVGAIYTVLGGIMAALGIIFFVADIDVLDITFFGIGALFLILGIIFLCVIRHQKRRAERLIQGGRYIWGEVVDTQIVFSERVGHTHPVRLVAKYVDPYGTTHMFTSKNLYRLTCQHMIGQKVKIYIEGNNFDRYYVAIDEADDDVVYH